MLTSNPNLTLALIILALLMGTYCLWQVISLSRLRKTFFAGKRGVDLEDVILNLRQELTDNQHHSAVLEQKLLDIEQRLTFAVQKVGLVRFNPFGDGGGNFSFSLALLDDHNSGVVITSMYGREQNRIYTKKISDGKCDTKLTEEELDAVMLANKKTKD